MDKEATVKHYGFPDAYALWLYILWKGDHRQADSHPVYGRYWWGLTKNAANIERMAERSCGYCPVWFERDQDSGFYVERRAHKFGRYPEE